MTSGIYEIRNKVNNKFYIGSSIDMDRRHLEHLSELRGNRHGNKYLQKAWNKYGENNFEFNILEYCGEGRIFEIEQMYLDQYFGVNCYNLRDTVVNLTNVSRKYWDSVKENMYSPILQFNKAGELIGYYKNICNVNTKIFNRAYMYKREDVWCKGYKFVSGLNYPAILDRIKVQYGENYFSCDLTIKDTKEGVVRVTGVNQLDLITNKIVNTFNSVNEINKVFNFDSSTIRKAIKNKRPAYNYNWEFTSNLKTNIKTQLNTHISQVTSCLYKIKLTKIETGEELIFDSITQACRELGIEDSARTKFTRVLKGVRKSTRGYKVEYENKE